MKPFTMIVEVADNSHSSIVLTDSQSNQLACNYIECIPLDAGVSGGYWIVTASGLQQGAWDTNIKLGWASGTVGMTIPIGTTHAAGGAYVEKQIFDLQNHYITSIGLQLYGAGAGKKMALNYGVKIPEGQGWKYRMTPIGA